MPTRSGTKHGAQLLTKHIFVFQQKPDTAQSKKRIRFIHIILIRKQFIPTDIQRPERNLTLTHRCHNSVIYSILFLLRREIISNNERKFTAIQTDPFRPEFISHFQVTQKVNIGKQLYTHPIRSTCFISNGGSRSQCGRLQAVFFILFQHLFRRLDINRPCGTIHQKIT